MSDLSNAQLWIWIFAIILVGFTWVQAFLFLRVALRFNKKHNIFTKEELMTAAKTGATASLGPGINTVFLGLSMISLIGGGYTFMRCGVIGAPMFELMIIEYASNFLGYDTTSGTMTASIFTFFVFAGALGTICYVLAPVFTLRPLEMAGRKKGNGKPNIVMQILPKVGLSVFLVMSYDYITAGVAQATAFITAFIVGVICTILISKGKKWLNSWSLMFSTVLGITAAQIVNLLFLS